MRYPPNLLEEILRRTDIVQLVARRVKLTRRGRVFWGCCPFHKEKSPSFKVENERRNYKCFGCGAGGDAFKWLTETEGLSFPEAVQKLAGEAGVELPRWSAEDEAREEKKKSLYDVIEAACAFYEQQLLSRNGEAARGYLKARGLDEATQKRFRLGYAPSHNPLIEHLKTKNVTFDDMIAAGLARPAEDGRPMRDFFFDRVMFPIADPRGRIVAFGARALQADAKPKYINTGETPLFAKGRLLYNFAQARPEALKSGTIIVAEGYVDVIQLARAGFEASVAPLGTALTEDQLMILWRTVAEPIMAFDGDDAGLRAAHRASRLALPHLRAGYSLRFAFLPAGEDPDSLLRASGPAAMRKILDEAQPLANVLWRGEVEGKDFSTPERRAGLEHVLAEIVGQIRDAKVADYYRRDFEQRVFDSFKKRTFTPRAKWQKGTRGSRDKGSAPLAPVSAGLKASRLVAQNGPARALTRAADGIFVEREHAQARRVKETEIARFLLKAPDLAVRHGELLAHLPFSDRALDSLRHELLNLAASGFRLESPGLENHLVRKGMAELVTRYGERRTGGDIGPADSPGGADAEEIEARFLRAVGDLREIAEVAPERTRALKRFNEEPSDGTWADVEPLLNARRHAVPND